MAFTLFGTSEIKRLKAELREVKERSDVLDDACGVGLWAAVLYNADALDSRSQWLWSPEFRRLIGYSHEGEFPNVCQSWSDKLHPDDAPATFAAGLGSQRMGPSPAGASPALPRDNHPRPLGATG